MENRFFDKSVLFQKSSLEMLPGYNPAREEKVVLFWYIRWICEPIKYSSHGTVEATVKVRFFVVNSKKHFEIYLISDIFLRVKMAMRKLEE